MARTLTRLRQPSLVSAAAGILVAALVVLICGAPVAWLLLAVCGVVSVAVLVPAWREGRWFEPLPLIAAVVLFRFVMRPLQLFLASKDLLSYRGGQSSLRALPRLDAQELALYATTRMHEALQPALTRTMAACALFTVLVVVGYHLPVGRRPLPRLAQIGRRTSRMDVRLVVIACAVLSLCGQAVIIARTGGLTQVANTQLKQRALETGLALQVLACFGIVGVIVWAAWRRPASRLAWVGFLAFLLEISVFYALTGSRTRVLSTGLALIVVAHYLWRPLRLRTVLLAIVAGLLFASAALAVRDATETRSFARALPLAPRYMVDPRVVLNDTTEFDQLFYATSTVGRTLHQKHGGWFVQAFHSYVPSFIDPNKPESPDISFRKSVWGDEVKAGRPPTVIGDFYYDFGFAGIAVGALLLGLLARTMLGLLAAPAEAGRPYRVALYALSLVVLHQLIINTYAIALGTIITLVVPYLVAVHGIGRLPVRRLRHARGSIAHALARARA